MENSYPLHWPTGVPRTKNPSYSRFDRKRSFERSRKELKRHPDNGGSHADMTELNQAYAEAKKELGY